MWREAACTQRKAPLDPSTSYPSISHPLSSLLWPQGPLHSAYFALTNTVATPPTDGTVSWTTRLHLIVYTSASATHQRLPGSVSVQYGVGRQRHMCTIRVRRWDLLAASCAHYCTVHSQSVYTWEVISPAITKRGREKRRTTSPPLAPLRTRSIQPESRLYAAASS